MKTNIKIKGMHCTACKMLIEDIASDIAGITACTVDVKGEQATVTHTNFAALETLKQEIRNSADYEVD